MDRRKAARTITIEALTRVEGEGGLSVRLSDGAIEDVQLRIYEPPRFFEAFLRGRPLREVPDIVARICGICPVAYQMTAVHAIERALGAAITPEIRRLRRLLYCGEWIESHGLHMHLLHAPDFFNLPSGIALAEQHPEAVTRGLRLKKQGNRLLEVLGGRAIHPVNVAVGGFYRAPKLEQFAELVPDFEWGLEAAIEATRWAAGFTFPEFTQNYELVSLSHPDEYPMNEGRIVSSRGLSIEVDDYDREFAEVHAAHSTALQSERLPARTPYLVGPLARVGLNLDRLSPKARRLADEVGIEWPSQNMFHSIVARGLELTHAFEEALEILRAASQARPSRVPLVDRDGEGCAATEAPRGLIFHRYRVRADGTVAEANIIPPTSQNQRQIEADLRGFLPTVLNGDDEAAALECEKLIRNYDPCISCSTHFLKLQVERT
ncbi:MAG: Ni/Fe hydrogenase subunit alpha [Planctomyces sp.]|nr:Ni/Fe hydrogenase subunit alpha [Planctomyces sp.]